MYQSFRPTLSKKANKCIERNNSTSPEHSFFCHTSEVACTALTSAECVWQSLQFEHLEFEPVVCLGEGLKYECYHVTLSLLCGLPLFNKLMEHTSCIVLLHLSEF